MSDLDHKPELRPHLLGFVLAVALTLAAFALTLCSTLPSTTILIVIGILRLAQMAVHLRFFGISTCRARNARICN